MIDRSHRVLLAVYRRLPVWLRRSIVRLLAPQFTAGAVCLVERDDGRVLLIKQSYRTHWGLPGGLLKRHEAPAAAAVREVEEEVGLRVQLVGEPVVVVDGRARRIDIAFRARPTGDADAADVASPTSPEIVDVRWFDPTELPRLQRETAALVQALARASWSPPSRPLRDASGA